MQSAGEWWPCIWEKGCWLPIKLLFLPIICLASVFLSVLTWKEMLTCCTYFPFDLFFSPPLIRDDGILEPFIIKRHSRNIHFASVRLILAYTIKSWHLHKLAQSQLFVCSPGIFKQIWRPSLYFGCSYSLLSLLAITDFTYWLFFRQIMWYHVSIPAGGNVEEFKQV